ncbi:cytochrome [Specibacter sp. NPDC057265]|uniref:cytochrome n=1 Tax=Specibacter sp. NPDC057265 TaxID=3346075 RepID=UPI0036257CC3
MTAPALAHSTELGRMYARSLQDPPTVPSITTVIGQQASSLDGWIGYMAATAAVNHPDLGAGVGNPGKLRTVVRESSNAAEQFRDSAAARGDRVHQYCEQLALRTLDRPHRLAEAREALAEKGEENFALRFDAWWQQYDVQPLVPEITVWNQSLGYAGTLDLVAKIGGRLCIIDYKTKGTDRNGQVKSLDAKVVMQLVAGLKAEESIVDEAAGEWEPWKYGQDPILLGVAIGETEVRTLRANPEVLKAHWFKFASLRRVWQTSLDAAAAGPPLFEVPPPAPESAH